jgi:prepilin-type N-terminal cleavage/methylation domain-containing protein
MKHKGFSLIELLFVISIISVLSSIILSSLSIAREKGNIAAGQKFSSSLHHVIGDELVGEWTFNQDTADDSSGWGNNATINGASFVDGVMGRAMIFDGSNDYLDCGDNENLNPTDKITFEVWIKPGPEQNKCYDGISGNYGVAGNVDMMTGTNDWSWQLRFGSPGDCYLGFQFREASTLVGRWVTAKQNLKEGQWYHVAGTFDGTNINFYLNGSFKDKNTLNGIKGYATPNKLLIGNAGWGGYNTYFTGLIDDVRIYHKSLTAAQIQQHYAEGLADHQALASK